MKEPAQHHQVMIPIMAIGQPIVDGWLASLSRESLDAVLDRLQDPVLMDVWRHLKQRTLEQYIGRSAMEGLQDSDVTMARLQTFTAISFFDSLLKNGELALEGEHPIVTARVAAQQAAEAAES